jgi:hypothetical protein
MAKRPPRTVVGNVLLLLSLILVLSGALAGFGNAFFTHRPLTAAVAALLSGCALAVIAGLILRDVSPPLEVLLIAASIPMTMFGLSLTMRQVAGKSAPPIFVGGSLLLFGALGLYCVRELRRRRLYPRRTQTPSNNRWRGP